ncbi:hypothetical protein D3C78_1031410 [compost metagenome]
MDKIVNYIRVIELHLNRSVLERINDRYTTFRITDSRAWFSFVRCQNVTAIIGILHHVRLYSSFIRSQHFTIIIEYKNLTVLHSIFFLNGYSDPFSSGVDIYTRQVSVCKSIHFG